MLKFFKDKRFFPLFSSHFLSAFSSALVQDLFLFSVVFNLLQDNFFHIFTISSIYFLSFFLTAPLLGQLVDKYQRSKLIRIVRGAEVVLLTICYFGFLLESPFLLILSVAGLGVKTSFARILTYSLFSEQLPSTKLLESNIFVKPSTYIAALIAGLFVYVYPSKELFVSSIFILAMGASFLSFLSVSRVIPSEQKNKDMQLHLFPTRRISSFLFEERDHKNILMYLLGIAWVWFIGGVYVYFLNTFVEDVLFSNVSVVALLVGIFSAGFIVGSFLLSKLKSDRNIAFFVPFSLFFASLFLMDFVFASRHVEVVSLQMGFFQFIEDFKNLRLGFDLFTIGLFMALYTIPLYTMLQKLKVQNIMGQIFGISNCLNAAASISGMLIALAFLSISVSLSMVYFFFALMSMFFSFYMFEVLPDEKKRKFFKFVLKKLFSVRVEGIENIHKAGDRVLILANHTSYIDALLIAVFVPEKITFFVNEKIFKKRWTIPLLALMRVRPLDPISPYAAKEMAEEMKTHRFCMFFVEGEMAGGHTQMKMYEAPALMAQKAKAELLPILIKGASHTFFSRIKEKEYTRWFPKISLEIKPIFTLPQKIEKNSMREERIRISSLIHDILSHLSFEARDIDRTLFNATIDTMSFSGRFKKMIEDTERKPVAFMEMFMKSFVLGRLMKKVLPRDDSPVGILLPTANVTAMTIYGLMSFGRVPAMLNFSAGIAQIIAACKTTGVKSVISSQKVIKLGKLEAIVEALEAEGIRVERLEFLAKRLTFKMKMLGVMGALFPRFTHKFVLKGKKVSPDDPATILFTSGSEGFPKAVFLSHKNIIGNTFQAVSTVDVYGTDVLMNSLPMFHSFGLIAGTFLPILCGIKTVFYPTPLHYRIIPELCNSVKATIMFGTDTFLAGYAKCANPYDFNTIRLLLSGAEKVKESTRRIWSEKFGARVLEGYGATECSPVISLNTPLFNKSGSVGKLIPGMEYKLKEVDGIKEGKELLLKGPNVMLGYMRVTDPMKLDPPSDGWYDTGDIVDIDEDGFIVIKGRSKRFAKIGGEMVSLTAVETVIAEKWTGFVHGIVSVPDSKKGEQLVLVTTCPDVSLEELKVLFKEKQMPEISIPRKISFTLEPPLLGSGKFNYIKAKEIVLDELEERSA
ncbi:MAG: MFS transporter [Alphaproteobacteria bacterium]|nr:MFS transporter [Alphaproteobacteria bacterium]NCB49552.1 MFS transporter [Alphaproteobacteria bacterium]